MINVVQNDRQLSVQNFQYPFKTNLRYLEAHKTTYLMWTVFLLHLIYFNNMLSIFRSIVFLDASLVHVRALWARLSSGTQTPPVGNPPAEFR